MTGETILSTMLIIATLALMGILISLNCYILKITYLNYIFSPTFMLKYIYIYI